MESISYPSTGLDSLDELLNHLRLGDNVVWQVDDIDAYKAFVTPYVERAIKEKRKIVYIRFSSHPPILEPTEDLDVVKLDANIGFESFSTQVHKVIKDYGVGVYYVFDCLSDLLSAWATDMMVGNFFMVTCPYLYELDTVAYFAIFRDNHSFRTVARIRETTQLLIDIYSLDDNYYIHPLKVWDRYSPTMFLPHQQVNHHFIPVANSVDAARLFSYITDSERKRAARNLDYWDRLFLRCEELLERPSTEEEQTDAISQMCRLVIGREDRIVNLAMKYFTLQELLDIKARMIGTGYIGGKAVGMLLARKILQSDTSFDWDKHLEMHDSFFIGSDVFHTYIVENGSWKMRMEQKTPEGYFDQAAGLREKLFHGKFPAEIKEQFQEVIEYFGQSPIIVRSSSLLEDSFGNAFAGKYESIFLVNQGSPEVRYQQFENAVRRIYASTMSEDALTYRKQRGLDQLDEQMALLVQRVSGVYHGDYFFPDVAGVGVSYNTFVWNSSINPDVGMLRVVFGLGTRAVDRVEDDYPRIASLDQPLLRPQAGKVDIKQFSQHYVDLLNLRENTQETVSLTNLLKTNVDVDLDLIAIDDPEANLRMRQLGIKGPNVIVLTFDKLLSETDFSENMKKMLSTLQQHYDYPVDIEFTLNFSKSDQPRINLLQCRPLETKGSGSKVQIPEKISDESLLFRSHGAFMGGSVNMAIQRIIYIDPQNYIDLPQTAKYDIARLVGKLNRQIADENEMTVMLIGPGRWGTTTPSLGVPVSFSEINKISVVCEMSYPSGNLIPELSYGSHFFQDLVETEIFYVALFCEKSDVTLNSNKIIRNENILTSLVPDSEKYQHVLRVYDLTRRSVSLMSDVISQQVVCFD